MPNCNYRTLLLIWAAFSFVWGAFGEGLGWELLGEICANSSGPQTAHFLCLGIIVNWNAVVIHMFGVQILLVQLRPVHGVLVEGNRHPRFIFSCLARLLRQLMIGFAAPLPTDQVQATKGSV